MGTITWLPPLYDFDCKSHDEWVEIEKCLFTIYENDFVHSICFYRSYVITIDRRINPKAGREFTFWKLISRNTVINDPRDPDFERARRLPWCRPVILNCSEQEVVDFDYTESDGKIRTYIWLFTLDYVVIIEKKLSRNQAFLVSQFHIDGDSKRGDLKKKYNKRIT